MADGKTDQWTFSSSRLNNHHCVSQADMPMGEVMFERLIHVMFCHIHMKHTATNLGRLTDFSGFELCWKHLR